MAAISECPRFRKLINNKQQKLVIVVYAYNLPMLGPFSIILGTVMYYDKVSCCNFLMLGPLLTILGTLMYVATIIVGI